MKKPQSLCNALHKCRPSNCHRGPDEADADEGARLHGLRTRLLVKGHGFSRAVKTIESIRLQPLREAFVTFAFISTHLSKKSAGL
jgi:hypothetical protein